MGWLNVSTVPALCDVSLGEWVMCLGGERGQPWRFGGSDISRGLRLWFGARVENGGVFKVTAQNANRCAKGNSNSLCVALQMWSHRFRMCSMSRRYSYQYITTIGCKAFYLHTLNCNTIQIMPIKRCFGRGREA